MVTIDEINSRETLKAWLETLPQETDEQQVTAWQIAVAVSVRSGLRVLPIYWRSAVVKPSAYHGEYAPLSVLRSALLRFLPSSRAISVVPARSVIEPEPETERLVASGDITIYADASYAAADAVLYNELSEVSGLGSVIRALHCAAIASDDTIWESLRSDLKGANASEMLGLPLSDGRFPFAEEWSEVVASVDANSWAFWIWWYEGLLNGTAPAPDSPLLMEIATSDEIDWEDEAQALATINAIWKRHQVASANSEALLVAHQLMEAALADFQLDQASRLMRMQPFAKDLKFLDDPELLASFLEDAEELREDIDGLAEKLKREGRAMQGAGAVGHELELLSEEFSKARQLQKLNVGAVVKFGEFLHGASLDAHTRAEFGLLSVRLDQIVEGVSVLVRNYFGQTLLRFAPLEELALEEGTSAWEYLNELRAALREMTPEAANRLTPLAEADVKVLQLLADEVERVLRARDGASGAARSSFERDVNYRLSLLTVSISLYAVRAKEVEGTLRPHVDGLLGQMKRIKGLWALWEAFRTLLKWGG